MHDKGDHLHPNPAGYEAMADSIDLGLLLGNKQEGWVMAVRNADAEWLGDLKSGKGKVKLGSGAFEGAYSYNSRFEDGAGTNPEELIAAAHAGCFSMALSAGLSQAGHPPTRIHTAAKVIFGPAGGGFAISKIELTTEGTVPGIDAKAFEAAAQDAKANCPVSKALKAVEITLSAKLT